MKTITLTATVDESRRLLLTVPDDVPLGQIKVTIELPEAESTLEELRALFLAAGILDTSIVVPDDAMELSDEELDEMGRLLAGGDSVVDLINEEREERF
jgi:hypothetical protein